MPGAMRAASAAFWAMLAWAAPAYCETLAETPEPRASNAAESPLPPADTSSQSTVPNGRQRVDLSITRFDAAEGDITLLFPAYTLAVPGGLLLGIGTNLVHIDAAADNQAVEEFGIGDTTATLQYAPSLEITASPWVPDTIGFSAALTAPTGDAEKSLGADAWIVDVGLGWSFPTVSDLWLVPSAYYSASFDEGRYAIPSREYGLSLELRWVFEGGVWFGYRPTLFRDLELGEWSDDHNLVLGKIFQGGFGVSLEYGRLNRLESGISRDTYTTLINVYYQFGRPL